MEIKEGMFIRTRINGSTYIRKVINIEKSSIFIDKLIRDDSGELHNATQKEAITKASYNIIDLIEEGDYVNGYKAIMIDDNNSSIRVDGFSWGTNAISYENIKSIVTKEQFKNMEYEVK